MAITTTATEIILTSIILFTEPPPYLNIPHRRFSVNICAKKGVSYIDNRDTPRVSLCSPIMAGYCNEGTTIQARRKYIISMPRIVVVFMFVANKITAIAETPFIIFYILPRCCGGVN